ncbi:MAG: hypothetical protein SGJ18_16055 [Pseudomonadota bacterium]|nr:hypothetical protein [Pseudomonadota bacterium]
MRFKALIAIFSVALASLYLFRSCNQGDSPTSAPTQNQEHDTTKAVTTEEESPREIASAQKDIISSEEAFLNIYPGNWTFKRENGHLNFIAGGNIPAAGNDKDSVKKFVTKIAPLLGVPAEQFEPEFKETSRSALSVMFLVEQRSDGFSVYQGNLSVQARNVDGAVFLINNQMRDVGPFNKSPRLSSGDAQKIIEKTYFNEIDKIALVKGPVIFARERDKTELAWVFNVTFNSPQYQAFEVVIGAQSGQELHQQSLVIH